MLRVNSASIESVLINAQVRWNWPRQPHGANTAFAEACSTESCYAGEDIKADQRNTTKAQLKLTFPGAGSDRTSSRNVLPTDCVGVPLFPRYLQTVKKPAVKKTIFKENRTTV